MNHVPNTVQMTPDNELHPTTADTTTLELITPTEASRETATIAIAPSQENPISDMIVTLVPDRRIRNTTTLENHHTKARIGKTIINRRHTPFNATLPVHPPSVATDIKECPTPLLPIIHDLEHHLKIDLHRPEAISTTTVTVAMLECSSIQEDRI